MIYERVVHIDFYFKIYHIVWRHRFCELENFGLAQFHGFLEIHSV